MSLAALIVLLPLLAALLLAALPGQAVRLNIAASAGSLALALLLLAEGPGGAGLLRPDALNQPLVLIASLVGLGTAIFSAQDVAHENFDRRRMRWFHAAFQGFMATHFLALLSDNLGIMWVAIEAGTLACVLMVALHRTSAALEAAWKFFILCSVGIALALFGIIVLALAAQPLLGHGEQLSFAALRLAAQGADPALLNLAFVFLLVGFGTKAGLVPLHSWLPDAHAEGPTPIAAVLSGLLLNAAMLGILRSKAVVGANAEVIPPGGFLIALGLASLLLAGFSLWRRRDAKRLFGWSSIEHMGIATIAFGIGGVPGHMAGLLHLWGHSLVKSAAFFAIGRAARIKGGQTMDAIGGLVGTHPMLGWGLAMAMAALAGLPPFSLFASELLLATEAGRERPWLLPLLILGLLVAGTALLHNMQRLCFGAPTPEPAPMRAGIATLLPLWTNLVLAALLALALPAPLAAMLLDAARALS
ncbi:hydrogenase 4 subunit F [Roseococcus sp. SYP-B2431]|uniref:proton-conducting transporter transmembrane domain-containing protein n=1 Tax=Roseococcus sp. SYP-B2431 TaxID=2496640 RepID=UPI00103AEF9D|nr:proton-conducting transporter membrane subunit [Roseococcus sp. SYP-B2431]TCH98002.1 hydrogenase 4 subunit F [Roseococcus sp. SYP-B2431]